MPQKISLSAARALILHIQVLTTLNGTEPTPTCDTIYDTVFQLGYIQIDTLLRVQRAHYLTLWSRLGQYDPADFDRLIYDPAQRRLFEYWQHAASIIPLEEYRYRLDKIQWFKDGGGWWPTWGEKPENRALAERVYARIQQEGPLRAADFKSDGKKRGAWWDWKPAKRALEYFYNRGELMISDRVNFQRVYDVRERVLPEWVKTAPPTREDTIQHLLERSARAVGLGEAKHIAGYAYMKRREAEPVIKTLLAAGTLVEVETKLHTQQTGTLLIHRDNLSLLQQAADGALHPARTTFLNPFDNLFWAKGRDQLLWGFRQTLEAYKPAAQRIWGYYCLPILHRDRLVGRFDPKLDRKTGTLLLKALYLEPGIDPTGELVADVAAALRDFMAWHQAHDLVIERSDPIVFGKKLLTAL